MCSIMIVKIRSQKLNLCSQPCTRKRVFGLRKVSRLSRIRTVYHDKSNAILRGQEVLGKDPFVLFSVVALGLSVACLFK